MSESNDRKIDDATPDTNVTGVEKIPVSDGGIAKYVTIAQLVPYLISVIGQIETVSGFSVENDKVYVNKDGEFKNVAASEISNAIVSVIANKESASGIAASDKVLISKSGTVKTMTVQDLADAVAAIVKPIVRDFSDVDELISNQYAYAIISAPKDGDLESGEYVTRKMSLGSIVSLLVNDASAFIDRTERVNDGGVVLVANKTGASDELVIQTIDLSKLPFGDGNVKADTTRVLNKNAVAVFTGAGSREIKQGAEIVSSVTDATPDWSIPTVAVIRTINNNALKYSGTLTNGNILSTDGTGAVANLAKKTTLSGSDEASDLAIPTEKAVVTSLAEKMDAISATDENNGMIPFWNNLTKSLAFGFLTDSAVSEGATDKVPTTKGLVDYIAAKIVKTVTQTSDDNHFPTALAVYNALYNAGVFSAVKSSVSSPTYGKIPQWGYDKNLNDGLDLTTSVDRYSSDYQIPTAKAVYDAANVAVTVQSSRPQDGASGFATGKIVCAKESPDTGLYVNIGTVSSSQWLKFAVAS